MKTALFFKLLFVCLACVAIRPVSAQVLGAGVFELKGQVVDSLTNEPVSFATLRVTRGYLSPLRLYSHPYPLSPILY